MSRGERVGRHSEVSGELALASDAQLSELVEQAPALGSGIGGASARCEVTGVPVFVYALMRLVNWLVTNVCGIASPGDDGPARRNEFIRACAAGADPTGAPPALAAMIRRYAPPAAIMNDFSWDLFGVDRATPYPAQEMERALQRTSD